MEATQIALTFPIPSVPLVKPDSVVSIDTFFPEDEANRIAEIESFNKHLFRPNTYLHKWWARRAGSTFRYILKQLVPDLSKRDYYTPGGLEGLTILDPMMGGGTIIHEAIRLGANVIGYDIDPIPVLQAKASLTDISVAAKQEVFNYFLKQLSSKLAKYYHTTCPICHSKAELQFILYGLRKISVSGEIIVVDSFILREEQNGDVKRLELFYPEKTVSISGSVFPIIDKEEARKIGVNGKSSDLLSIPFMQRYVPLVAVGHCNTHRTFFKKVDGLDLDSISSAHQWVLNNMNLSEKYFHIPKGPKSDDLRTRNIQTFIELFFPRQLAYIAQSRLLLQDIPAEHLPWLTLLISTSLEFNSALCGYKGAEKRRPGAIRHVFSHHAYSFPYTSLENNPVFSRHASGTLKSLFVSRIVSAGVWARQPVERKFVGKSWVKRIIPNEIDLGKEAASIKDFKGETRRFIVSQNNSTRMQLPSECVDFIVTDPPYFDSVQYSDLSNFFRCWLRCFLPGHADWRYRESSSAVAEAPEQDRKFGSVIEGIWKECNRLLKRPHGRLIFTYHHWRYTAWAQLNIALKKAGFVLSNAYVVHSENPISVHIRNLHSLKHDTILVLKPHNENKKHIWPKPEPVTNFDSYSFCQSCGQMTGWILDSDLPVDEIEYEWSKFIEG